MNKTKTALLPSVAAMMILCSVLAGCSFGGKKIPKNEEAAVQQTSLTTSSSSLAAPEEVDLSAETPLDSSSAEMPDVGTPTDSDRDIPIIETKLPDQIVVDPGVPTQRTTTATRAPSLDNAANTITTTTSATTIAPPQPESGKSITLSEPDVTSSQSTFDQTAAKSDTHATTTTKTTTTTTTAKVKESSLVDNSDDYIEEEPTSGDADSSSNAETLIDRDEPDSSEEDDGSDVKVIELPVIPVG